MTQTRTSAEVRTTNSGVVHAGCYRNTDNGLVFRVIGGGAGTLYNQMGHPLGEYAPADVKAWLKQDGWVRA